MECVQPSGNDFRNNGFCCIFIVLTGFYDLYKNMYPK